MISGRIKSIIEIDIIKFDIIKIASSEKIEKRRFLLLPVYAFYGGRRTLGPGR